MKVKIAIVEECRISEDKGQVLVDAEKSVSVRPPNLSQLSF